MKNRGSIVLLICCSSCKDKNYRSEERKRIIENYLKSYNDFDLEGMTKDLDRNIVYKNISKGRVDLRTQGLDKFMGHLESEMQYTHQRERTAESWIFGDTKVSIDIKYKMILAIDLTEELQAGDTLELKGKVEFLFDNEKIQRITEEA